MTQRLDYTNVAPAGVNALGGVYGYAHSAARSSYRYSQACWGAERQILSVTVFEAAMGPMIGASIVAMDHELDPPLLTLMVGVGIPLLFLTIPVWWHLLSFL